MMTTKSSKLFREDSFLDDIKPLIESVRPTPNSIAFLAHSGGTLLVHADNAHIGNKLETFSPFTDNLLFSLEKTGETKSVMLDGRPPIVSVTSTYQARWLLGSAYIRRIVFTSCPLHCETGWHERY